MADRPKDSRFAEARGHLEEMVKPKDPREGAVWKSIFRPGSIYRPGYRDTSRDRALATMNNVLYHLHPVKLKRHGLKLTYTYCLGGLSFFLFIVLTVTAQSASWSHGSR